MEIGIIRINNSKAIMFVKITHSIVLKKQWEMLKYLLFADDIVLIANDLGQTLKQDL